MRNFLSSKSQGFRITEVLYITAAHPDRFYGIVLHHNDRQERCLDSVSLSHVHFHFKLQFTTMLSAINFLMTIVNGKVITYKTYHRIFV